MKSKVLLVFLCSFSSQLLAQQFNENGFTRYTTLAGLSSNEVTGISQDAAGYLWIATGSGINRFDGSRFVQYHSTDDQSSLGSEDVTDATWLDKDRLGFYTSSGLHIINTKTGETRNLFVPYKRQLYLYKFNTIHGVKADDKGNIYLLTRSGFYHFKDYKLVWRFDNYRDDELNNTHFHFGGNLFDYDTARLLIVSSQGLFLYNKEKRILSKAQETESPFFAEFTQSRYRSFVFLQPAPGQFFVVKQGSDSLFYFNISSGKKTLSRLPFLPAPLEFHYRTRLFKITDTSFCITRHHAGFYNLHFKPATGVITVDPQPQFAAFLCNSLLSDKDGRLWIGTGKGLFQQNSDKANVQTVTLPQSLVNASPNLRLTHINVVADKVYAGSLGEAGLLLFDKKTLQFNRQVILDKTARSGNRVSAILPVNNSNILVGTYHDLKLYNTRSGIATSVSKKGHDSVGWINDLRQDHAGTIWVSGADNVARYMPATGKLSVVPLQRHVINLPVYLAQDKQGFMWMASHGLARYNDIAKAFDLKIDSFPFIKMPDRQVAAFIFDQYDNLWFNSPNNGLICYNKKDKTFLHLTNRNGLPDNNVLALLNIRNQLWIACVSGVACLDLLTNQVSAFGRQNGFPDEPIIKGCRFFYDSTARQIYLGSATTLVRFDPEALLMQKPPPRTFIESVVIGGRQTIYLPGPTLQTSWKEKELRINIGSINYRDGSLQRYAYRVAEDTLTQWTDIGTQASFSIANLSAGTHSIQVMVSSINNAWPVQVTELQLIIPPPLWQKNWFRLLMGVIVLAILYLFVKWRISIVKRKEMVKTQLEKLKADNYKNQFELEQISNYFSTSLADRNTAEEVLWDVAQNLIARMHYEECVLYGWNSDKTRMVQKAAYGPKGLPGVIEADGFEVEPGQGIVGLVMNTKEPVLIQDTRLDSRYRVDDCFRLSEICVPILHNNELLGIIDSEHQQVGYFNERDIKILTTVATLIGNKLKQLESEQSLEVKKKELASINEQLAEARLSALQAQMNPHFVFNALNSIKRMILDEDNEMASRYLSKFALMIRMTLEHSKEVFVTLDENVEYINNYLAMEKLRFGDTFSYSVDVDEALDVEDTMLPSMMIQPLVENAIWHGLMQSEKEKKVRICFDLIDGEVVCTVEDNGIGINRSEKLRLKQRPLHRSVGLENLKKRIRIINEKYNTGCVLIIRDLAEIENDTQGTQATLKLKLLNIYQKS
jgi:ligand-binding sensor domain-containing protein/putative methionine-R-sulfoxide reductase with GAF domain